MRMALASYRLVADGVEVQVEIVQGDLAREYHASLPDVSPATLALLESVKEDLLKETKVLAEDIFDPAAIARLKTDFRNRTEMLISQKIPGIIKKTSDMLIGYLLHEMLGLGRLEALFADEQLEEVVVNSSKEPVWVYHKRFGWLVTNIYLKNEQQIHNYASIIARRVGRQVTNLEPLLNAHLVSGDRANATLFPISTKGNTITVRKFARKPWVVTDLIENGTLNAEVAAFLWLVIQYELNLIIAGGTSSGKTSLMNALMPFIQPYHRIISIEDTREIRLPDFLHWVPLTTREPNPEGKGAVEMLDLLVNALRMRPDRIVVGEIRRGEQAEVLFEAMHTGHSVYATLHADTVEQVLRRMTNPPINIPEVMLESLHAVAVMYRDRKEGIRRLFQLAELLPTGETGDKITLKPNVLYRAKPGGEIVAHDPCVRILDALKMHTGMTQQELFTDLENKITILDWMTEHKVTDINEVGLVVARYYADAEAVVAAAHNNENVSRIIARG